MVAARVDKPRLSAHLLTCLWFASLTSGGELLYWSVIKIYSRYRVVNDSVAWRVPLGYSLIYAVIAAGVALAWAVRRRPVSERITLFLCAAVTSIGWLLLTVHSVAGWSLTVLGIGIASQVATLRVTRGFVSTRFLRLTAIPFAAAIGLAGGARYLEPIVRERAAISGLPSVAASRPNVLLIVLDTVRAKSLSLYGSPRLTTPSLEDFARRGVVFDRAYSAAPWTLPSHGAMFTGHRGREIASGFNVPLRGDFPTLAEMLRRDGYLTAGFVANRRFGIPAYGLGRGFDHYEGGDPTTPITSLGATGFGQQLLSLAERTGVAPTAVNLGRKNAARVSDDFLTWLGNADQGRPFFAFLNYLDAHAPYLPPDDFATKFASHRPDGRLDERPFDQWSPAGIQELNLAYDSAIAYLDHEIGKLLRELERSRRLDNTIVIITSDHGEQFGEHGLLEHSNSLYLTLLHVPLILVYPQAVEAGQRIERPVSLRDLAATVLHLSESVHASEMPGMSWFTGGDRPVFSGAQRVTDFYPSWYPARRGTMRSVVAWGFHYIIEEADRSEELYALDADPEELTNVADRYPEIVQKFRCELRDLPGATRFPGTCGAQESGADTEDRAVRR